MTWPVVQLVTVTEKIGSGATPRGGASVYVEDGALLIRSQNVLDNRLDLSDAARIDPAAARQLDSVAVRAGDVLVNITGDSVARVAGVVHPIGDARVNQHVAIVRPSTQVDSVFLQKFLVAPASKARLLALSQGGATRKALTKAMLERFEIPMPPLATQRAIAEVLGALDDKIAANARSDALAAELAETSYIRACRVASVERPLWEVVTITFGAPFSGGGFSEPGVGRPLIRIRDLKSHSCQVWTTESRPDESVVTAGDVVAGMDAEFRPSLWLGDDGVLNQRCLTADSNVGGRAFALEALKAPLSRIEGSKSATTVIHLNKSDLLRESVVVPDVSEMARFADVADVLRLRRVALAGESRHLARLRDTLLPHLMSGRITVREAEQQVEAVI